MRAPSISRCASRRTARRWFATRFATPGSGAGHSQLPKGALSCVSMDSDADFWGLFAIFPLATIGLYLVVQGFVRLTRRNRERDWQAVRGMICDTRTHGVKGEIQPAESLEYTYEFDGVNYRGSRVTPLPRTWLVRSP